MSIPDGMVELDGYVGRLLKKLDDLRVADNTIVVFTTDNVAEVMTWPDGGSTPFRGEKDTNWEGGWREPLSPLRVPKFFDLRADPFERAEESIKYNDWFMEQNFLLYAAPPMLAKWLESFKEFPPRAKAASFSIDQVVEKLMPKS